jgi:hypothetical protein
MNNLMNLFKELFVFSKHSINNINSYVISY